MSGAPYIEPSDGYHPAREWQEWGAWYWDDFNPAGYTEQEAMLAETLDHLAFDTVLDVGCGFGRIGLLIQRIRPEAQYHGIDASADQIAKAKELLPTGTYEQTAILAFDPGRRWDLVVASEVLMHQPPELIAPTVERLKEWAGRWVLSIDGYHPGAPVEVGSFWNWNHDYPGLYGDDLLLTQRVGPQTIFVVAADNPGREEQ